MSVEKTHENKILDPVFAFLDSNCVSFLDRLELLEKVSALHSGANLDECKNIFGWKSLSDPDHRITKLHSLILSLGIPFELAICSLSREPIPLSNQKKNGVYYTDYRLAESMAQNIVDDLGKNMKVADLAAGTGILLCAVARAFKKKYPNFFDEWLANNVYAYDLSELALKGATASFLSLSSNLDCIVSMLNQWKVCDSLFELPVEENYFDIIIGNPPWGKIKLTRPAYVLSQGQKQIYGSEYKIKEAGQYILQKNIVKDYSKKVKSTYTALGSAEVDLYMAFLQSAIAHVKPNGTVMYLIPAGIIRSVGTQPLREHLLEKGKILQITVLNNSETYFNIDSRFKFVMIKYQKAVKTGSINSIQLRICQKYTDIIKKSPVNFQLSDLKSIRPDLTIPEVSNDLEWELFKKISINGEPWGREGTKSYAIFSREVDMTNDRNYFLNEPGTNTVPVIEGRMVQAYRFANKSYVSGSGRAAKWKIVSSGGRSQYHIKKANLNDAIIERIKSVRIGYCDIAGQTNERAMMCTIIPSGVVCGNKVPTILFPNEDEDYSYFWIAASNSFVIDWFIRRIISTTINYFHILSVPMPQINKDPKITNEIIYSVKELLNMGDEYYSSQKMPYLRAKIESNIAKLFNLTKDDLLLIFKDFPLVDKLQPKLEGCELSCTFNLILSEFLKGSPEANNYIENNMKY